MIGMTRLRSWSSRSNSIMTLMVMDETMKMNVTMMIKTIMMMNMKTLAVILG